MYAQMKKYFSIELNAILATSTAVTEIHEISLKQNSRTEGRDRDIKRQRHGQHTLSI